jgi:glutamate synthase domain-containing protein 1/glutamate synthase domain-containing protein 3
MIEEEWKGGWLEGWKIGSCQVGKLEVVMNNQEAERILRSRRELLLSAPVHSRAEEAAEGGCGVLGFAANLPVAGRHVLAASRQMHNRGNGKGGGIAMAGLVPEQARVNKEILASHTLLQIALLDPKAREEVEAQFIRPHFEVAQAYELPRLDDYRAVEGLEVRPPDVWRYFVRVKEEVLTHFAEEKNLVGLPARKLEDEFVYQNTYRLNDAFYASLGEKRAFVLSQGRDLSVLKIVGYAEQVVEYYRLEDQSAHVWIAHQRYPTKGRVWHPGGAHPFIGLNEALVHNGDFANYHAVGEYLRQRNIGQQFLTDTEVSVQLFDLWDRIYSYPLEITLEAMAPTTEHDFVMLPAEKQELYRAVQRTHMHGSPDGPWFFIVARSLPDEGRYELLGITDTSMLRPQVFALYENEGPGTEDGGRGLDDGRWTVDRGPWTVDDGPWAMDDGQPETANGVRDGGVQIGLIASERQAINACLRSLAEEDERFQPRADQYWVARGGSHTDGGAFRFTFRPGQGLACADKFGVSVQVNQERRQVVRSQVDPVRASAEFRRGFEDQSLHAYDDGGAASLWRWLKPAMAEATWDEIVWGLDWLRSFAAQGDGEFEFALESLNLLRDRRYDSGDKKRASVLSLVDAGLNSLFVEVPLLGAPSTNGRRRLTWENRQALNSSDGSSPDSGGRVGFMLVVDALGFPPEGEESAARWMARAVDSGWRRLAVFNWRGGRFAACGLGPESEGVRIDLYGDVGDYAGSGLDGGEVHFHGDGQDQVGQILKRGKLVIHGDVGQTFLYGAKGGEIYVAGSAAGRPLINAVGKPRAVINGTCLDYLAESFMAGDPLNGGGFVILNGVTFDEEGKLHDLESPYPGGNLFSLASGGAIYLRDPYNKVEEDQLNGGKFDALSEADWALIEPYLLENERLFGIQSGDLLMVDGETRKPDEVYRVVKVAESGVLREKENR